MEELNKLEFDVFGDKYEFRGGGGGAHPAPNSVGSEEIKDDSVEMADLSSDVKDSMITDADRVTQEDLEGFVV